MAEAVHKARCECGGVRFSVTGARRDVLNCHCSQCRRMHGVYGAYTGAPRDAITMESEDTLTWYQSSEFARRGFCSRCGSNVFYDTPGRDAVSISAGLFDQNSGLKPTAHIFVGDVPDFYELNDDLPKLDTWTNDPRTEDD